MTKRQMRRVREIAKNITLMMIVVVMFCWCSWYETHYTREATAEVMPYILKLDKASRGAGYSLRFCPTNAQKTFLLTKGAQVLCSKEFFETSVKESKYNKGEIFEKMVTEFYGQEWTKDNVPFTEDGDLTTNGIAYQIKFEKATFTNEKTLARM